MGGKWEGQPHNCRIMLTSYTGMEARGLSGSIFLQHYEKNGVQLNNGNNCAQSRVQQL